jgi:hypothetical protein
MLMNASQYRRELRVYEDEKNEYGCLLHNQSGRMGVRDFDAIVERLSPELQAAFKAERAARWAELESFLAGNATQNGTGNSRRSRLRRVGALALAQRRSIEGLLHKAGQLDIQGLSAQSLPQLAAHRWYQYCSAGMPKFANRLLTIQSICALIRSSSTRTIWTARACWNPSAPIPSAAVRTLNRQR